MYGVNFNLYNFSNGSSDSLIHFYQTHFIALYFNYFMGSVIIKSVLICLDLQ